MARDIRDLVREIRDGPQTSPAVGAARSLAGLLRRITGIVGEEGCVVCLFNDTELCPLSAPRDEAFCDRFVAEIPEEWEKEA